MEPPCAPELPVPKRSSFSWSHHHIVAVPPAVQRAIGWPWMSVWPSAARIAVAQFGVVPSGLPDPAPGTTKSVGIGASNKTPPCAAHRLPPLQASLFSQTFVTGAVGVRMRTSTSVVIPEAVGFLMLPGTYAAFAPIGRFQMLSRAKGHSVALWPVADVVGNKEANSDIGGRVKRRNDSIKRTPPKKTCGTVLRVAHCAG